MTVSTMDLAAARTRVGSLLMDASAAIFPTAVIDQALAQALEEYNRVAIKPRSPVLPRDEIAVMVVPALQFEFGLEELDPPAETVQRIWFPYTAIMPENPPQWRRFRTFRSSGQLSVFLEDGYCGDGVLSARIYYRALHTLKDLNGGTLTTFEGRDDNLLCQGAAGYACLARAADLNEASATAEVETPNYGDLGVTLLAEFRLGLKPLMTMVIKGH